MKQFAVHLPAMPSERFHRGQQPMDSLEDQNSVVLEDYMSHMVVQEYWENSVNMEAAGGNAMNTIDYMGAEKFHMAVAVTTTVAVCHNFAEDRIARRTRFADTPASMTVVRCEGIRHKEN
jgi:hypothetical protein